MLGSIMAITDICYVLAKVPIYFRFWTRRKLDWVRTDRNQRLSVLRRAESVTNFRIFWDRVRLACLLVASDRLSIFGWRAALPGFILSAAGILCGWLTGPEAMFTASELESDSLLLSAYWWPDGLHLNG